MTDAPPTPDFDLVVAGSGFAGMTAAAVAAQAGLRPLVLDKAPDFGGTSRYAVHLWTATSTADLKAEDPDGHPEIHAVLVDEFPDAVEFVRSTGITFSEELDIIGIGKGFRVDNLTYLHRCRSMVEAAGGAVIPGHPLVDVTATDDGVASVTFRDESTGEVTTMTVSDVVLATGGFQASPELLDEHFGDGVAQRLLLRSNPHSTGDGIGLAQRAGGTIAGPMDRFYGHLVGSPLESFTPSDFVRLILIYSDRCVLLDTGGRRFCDESIGDHYNAQAVARLSDGRAFMIMDDQVRNGSGRAPIVAGLEDRDTLAETAGAGARVATADSLEELAVQLGQWGADAEQALEELRAASKGSSGSNSLGAAPYHAVEVRPAITFTHGGIRIDGSARVLDADGAPVAGLYAAGADVAIYGGGYGGGLSLGAVLGRRAALSIIERRTAARSA